MDIPLHAPEPQLTATRFAPLATAIVLLVPTKLTPCAGRHVSFIQLVSSVREAYRELHSGSRGSKGAGVALFREESEKNDDIPTGRLTWSMITPNLRIPVPVLPEYVMLDTVEPDAADLVLMRSAWSLNEWRQSSASHIYV